MIGGPLKKNITPPGFKGKVVKHAGKGASPFPPQPKPGPLTMGAPSMNNYAKATPLPTPPPPMNNPSGMGAGSPGPAGGAMPPGLPPGMPPMGGGSSQASGGI